MWDNKYRTYSLTASWVGVFPTSWFPQTQMRGISLSTFPNILLKSAICASLIFWSVTGKASHKSPQIIKNLGLGLISFTFFTIASANFFSASQLIFSCFSITFEIKPNWMSAPCTKKNGPDQFFSLDSSKYSNWWFLL